MLILNLSYYSFPLEYSLLQFGIYEIGLYILFSNVIIFPKSSNDKDEHITVRKERMQQEIICGSGSKYSKIIVYKRIR